MQITGNFRYLCHLHFKSEPLQKKKSVSLFVSSSESRNTAFQNISKFALFSDLMICNVEEV